MNAKPILHRRTWMNLAAATCVAGVVSADESNSVDEPTDMPESTGDANSISPIGNHCFFTKPLQSMAASDLADKLASFGFGGTECPIRRGGMVDPQKAAEQLPPHIDALAAEGLRIVIAATDINDPGDARTEMLLKLMATHGITHYRMAYYRYDLKKPLPPQIDRWRGMMTDLAAMNAQYKLQGMYQNHAGYKFYSGPIWDLYEGLKDIDPDHLGVAFDLRHATVEGGLSWPIEWALIRDHVRAFYAKDFAWKDQKVTNVPLGTGATDRTFYSDLPDKMKQMPISLHEEYLSHKDASLVPQHLQAIQRDYGVLRNWLS